MPRVSCSSAATGRKHPDEVTASDAVLALDECFVRPDTRINFMAMPDAIDALLALMDAPREELTSHVYNINAFNPSAEEFAALVRRAFPKADIRFTPDLRRQGIVDTMIPIYPVHAAME